MCPELVRRCEWIEVTYLLVWVHIYAHSLSRCTYKQGRLSFYFYFIFILFIYYLFFVIIYFYFFVVIIIVIIIIIIIIVIIILLFVFRYFSRHHLHHMAQQNLIRICRPKFGKSMTAAKCLNGFSSDIRQVYFDVLMFLIIGWSRFLTQRNALFFLYDTVICNLLLFVQIKNSWFLIPDRANIIHIPIDGLVQERRNSSVLAMELCLAYINPSIHTGYHMAYQWLNSLWPSDSIWQHRSWSPMAQEMACCLMAPSHYLNQCWLFISVILWHPLKSTFTWSAQDTVLYNEFEHYILTRTRWRRVKTLGQDQVGVNLRSHTQHKLWISTWRIFHEFRKIMPGLSYPVSLLNQNPYWVILLMSSSDSNYVANDHEDVDKYGSFAIPSWVMPC